MTRGLAQCPAQIQKLGRRWQGANKWRFYPQPSSGSSFQVCPSARDLRRPHHPPDPGPLSLTSFLSCLPTAIHYHILLALPPKETSHPPHCSPSHDSILALYLSISHLETCLCPSPAICLPQQVILPKYKPDHVIPLLNI